MPFYQEIKDDIQSIFLWKFANEDGLSISDLSESEMNLDFHRLHPKKQSEFLMIRRLLKLNGITLPILYKENGEPYLEDSDKFISITHSFPFAGLAISNKKNGIDIERIQPKILALRDKFINEYEKSWLYKEIEELEFLTIIWAIKESLYKLHASKYWSLKKHYEVSPFRLDQLENIKCRVFDDNFEDQYTAKVVKVDEYYLASVLE